MTLDQDTESEMLSSRDTLKNYESLTMFYTCTPEEHRLIEGQRRLDHIVSQCFETLDTLVYYSPEPPVGFDFGRKRHIDSGDLYDMSGALLTNSSVEENPFAAKSADYVGEDLVNPRLLLIEPSFSLHEPRKPKDLSPLPAVHHKLKSTDKSPKEGRNESSGLSQLESDNQQSQADQNLNFSTSPYVDWNHPNLLAPTGFSSWGLSGETGGKFNEFVENSAQPPSHQAQSSSNRRVTPVPAPQPWRRLGIVNPFGDDLPRTPTKKSRSHRPRATSTSQTQETTLSPSKPEVNGLSEPKPLSLNGFLHLRLDDKKHRNKLKRRKTNIE